MGRKSANGLPAGIYLDKHGVYWATLAGKHASDWRDRYPGRTLPRRKARSLTEAVERQRQLIDLLKSPRKPKVENPTTAAWVERWIDNNRDIRPGTRRRYLQSLQWQIRPLHIARVRILQLDRDLVREWVGELIDLPRQDDPEHTLSWFSIRNAFALFRAALKGAFEDGLIPTIPCQGVKLPPLDYNEITPMSPTQATDFLRFLDTYEIVKHTNTRRPHRQAALYHVAIRCGLRKGEINGLRWCDVDLERREIRVVSQLQDGERTSGKSKFARRSIPISDDLTRVLAYHWQNQEEEQSISPEGWNQEGYVFCSENGTDLNPANIWRQFDALQRRAGLTKICSVCKGKGGNAKALPCGACDGHGVLSIFRFHDMRHTYAALSLAAGVPIFTVSRRMGHSSIKVTSDLYGHMYDGHSDDAGAIDPLLNKVNSDAIPS